MACLILSHPLSALHETPAGHPECVARIDAVHTLLDEPPFADWPHEIAPEADWEDITRVHNEAYLQKLQEAIPDTGLGMLDGDTFLSPRSWDAAMHAAGACCRAVDEVLGDNETKRAFCAVRPPGHHAYPDHAEGFCLLNNIAIAAKRALDHHGCEKVAILDFDVHHGNGTDHVARADERIFFASTHQWPLYPGSGLPENDTLGRVINRTLNAGANGADMRALWQSDIFPKLEAWQPDLILISAGFDAHRDDPIAQLGLTAEEFATLTTDIVRIAENICDGRVVSTLEGGYNIPALASCVKAYLRALS